MSEPRKTESRKIKVTEDGPYLVSGSVPVTRKTPVMSEHGEPLTWKPSEPADTADRFALCRCGQSSNKPFCDGTHARSPWDGTEAAPTDSYADRATSLGGDGIEIFDDRPICVHAGFCGNQVTNVWKMAAKTGAAGSEHRRWR
jgi:CDGSH-type Zn-finger protein